MKKKAASKTLIVFAIALILGMPAAHAIFGSGVIRRTALAAKTGASVADATTTQKANDKIDKNLDTLRAKHQFDSHNKPSGTSN